MRIFNLNVNIFGRSKFVFEILCRRGRNMEKKNKRSLTTYIIISFSFSWILWITALTMGYEDISFLKYLRCNFESPGQILAHIVFRIAVYGPLIAAFMTTYIYSKQRGIKELIKKIFKVQVGFKWYLYLFLLPLFLNLIVVIIGLMFGIRLQSFFKSNISFNYLFLFFIYEILTSGLEEPGWRGFVLERLQNTYSAEKASWILGIIWAIWHYPYVISLYSDTGIITLLFSLIGFSMAIIGQTFIMTWFYNNTKSIFISILLHAWLNTSTTFILGNITIDNPIMGIIPALVTWGIVFILLKIYGGQTLTRRIAE